MFTKSQLIGVNGHYKTQSIFLETSLNDQSGVLMTLKDAPVEVNGALIPSLRILYMEDRDPTGFTTAIRVFGSWEHWRRCKSNTMINKYLLRYEDELDVSIRSGVIKELINTAMEEGGRGTTAAKYIAERGWDKRKAGAPTKEEKDRELKVNSLVIDEVQEDLVRLGLTKH